MAMTRTAQAFAAPAPLITRAFGLGLFILTVIVILPR
jgi:hypothetical protein